jgi:hypothetical protein
MPSVSKAQQAIMGQAWALRQGDLKMKDINPMWKDEIKKIAFGYKDKGGKVIAPMTDKELKKYASTKSKNLPERVEDGKPINEDWGSSDQSIMNSSIHKAIGSPTEMPSPFNPDLRIAAEEAVDFYWDEWEEYRTDRDALIDNAVRKYLSSYFKEQFELLKRMFEADATLGVIDSSEMPSFTPNMNFGKGINPIVPFLNPDSKKKKAGKGNLENLKDYRDWIKVNKK